MEPAIDLIPQEEKATRTKAKVQKALFIFGIALFLLTSITTGILVFVVSNFDTQISSLNASINDKKGKISDKADIEVTIRNLDTKQGTLVKILNDRHYYSILLDEIARRVPSTVNISTIDSSTPNLVSVSGVSTDYVSLAKFLNSLADPAIATSSATLNGQNLFTEVSISSVTLDPLNAQAKFNLNLSINSELLKK